MSSMSSRSSHRPSARRRARSNFSPLPKPLPSSRTTVPNAENRANSTAHVSPLRAWTIRPATQQRLPGSTSIKTGLGEKNLVGGKLGDLGSNHLVEHLEQRTGAFAGTLGGPSQRRHARDGCRPCHNLQQPPRYAQTRSEERRVGKECRSRWSPY